MNGVPHPERWSPRRIVEEMDRMTRVEARIELQRGVTQRVAANANAKQWDEWAEGQAGRTRKRKPKVIKMDLKKIQERWIDGKLDD